MLPLVVVVLLIVNATSASAQEAVLVVAVVDEANAPLPDVRVRVIPSDGGGTVASAQTDEFGTVRILVPPFGPYGIEANLDGYRLSGRFHVNPPAGETPLTLRMLVRRPVLTENPGSISIRPVLGSLRGRVLSLDGEPLAEVRVEAVTDPGG